MNIVRYGHKCYCNAKSFPSPKNYFSNKRTFWRIMVFPFVLFHHILQNTMKHSKLISLHGSRLTAHGSRLTAHGLSSLTAVVLLFCLAIGSHAQGVSQKPLAITFHFSGDTSIHALSVGKSSDKPLDTEGCLCELFANLTQIAPCGNFDNRLGKGQVPLDQNPCCCVDLEVWSTCFNICGFDVVFDNGNFDPLCNVCSLPPGWEYSQDPDGELHLNYSGPCSGSIQGNGPHLHFQFCGYNTPGQVCYTVTGYACGDNPSNGQCFNGGTPWCSPHFCSTITCGTGADVVTSSYTPFSIDAGFPNPTSSSISFGYSSPYNGVLSCTLFDVLGKTVNSSNYTISSGTGNVTIVLNGAQAGVYYCVFEINGQRFTRRIEVK